MGISNAFNQVVDKLNGWVEQFIVMLPNLAAAVLIVIVFWLLAKMTRQLVRHAADRVSDHRQVNSLLSTIGYIAVLSGGIFIALGVLQLEWIVVTLLGSVGILGLALGFAFQDITSNFISSILLSIRRPFQVGDIVETNDLSGVVEEVNLRSTVLRTFQGQTAIIPNKEVFQNPVTNYSHIGKRRIDLVLGVSYGDDLAKAKSLAIKAIEKIDNRDASHDIELFYDEFGGSSINFKLRFWIDFHRQADYLKAQSEAIMRVKKAFDENDITIPFPIRTLDFGVVGGEKLSDVLPSHLYQDVTTDES